MTFDEYQTLVLMIAALQHGLDVRVATKKGIRWNDRTLFLRRSFLQGVAADVTAATFARLVELEVLKLG
jgi:hypothetical protein